MKEIKIGSQVWAKENLKVTNFRNGEPIPVVQDQNNWSKMSTAAMCFTPEGEALYNWYAVNDSRGLAPEGWHVPSDTEWQQLVDFLGGDMLAGKAMKAKKFGGDNSSKFKASLSGLRYYDGSFDNVGSYAYFWSSSPNGSNAWYRILSSGNDDVNRFSNLLRSGFSVRCVRSSLTLEQRVEILERKLNDK